MDSLSKTQLACLQRLAHGGDSSSMPCSDTVLEQLLKLGLVRRISNSWLPLENPHSHYEISVAGRAQLERLARE